MKLTIYLLYHGCSAENSLSAEQGNQRGIVPKHLGPIWPGSGSFSSSTVAGRTSATQAPNGDDGYPSKMALSMEIIVSTSHPKKKQLNMLESYL